MTITIQPTPCKRCGKETTEKSGLCKRHKAHQERVDKTVADIKKGLLKENACFDLVCETIAECFTDLRINHNAIDGGKLSRIHVKEGVARRIAYAGCDMLKVWADCSHNFEFEKIKAQIIEYNETLLKARMAEKI